MAFQDLKRASSFRLGRVFVGSGAVAGLIAVSLVAISCAADLQGEPTDYKECAYQGACASGTSGGAASTGGTSSGGAGGSTAGTTSTGGSGTVVPPDDACLAPLFAKSCNACHSTAAAPAAGAHLALDTPNLGATLITKQATYEGVLDKSTCKTGALIIDPNNPAESVLLKKITKPDCGFVMPYGGQPLQPAEVSCIQDWVMKF